MLQDRQVERTVLKVARLADMYSQFIVKATIEPIAQQILRMNVQKGYTRDFNSR